MSIEIETQEVLNVIVNHKSIIAHFPSLKLVDLWTIFLLHEKMKDSKVIRHGFVWHEGDVV